VSVVETLGLDMFLRSSFRSNSSFKLDELSVAGISYISIAGQRGVVQSNISNSNNIVQTR
jgi:hypothetical protein